MLVLTMVVHGHEKFRLHTLHSTGLAWSMEFQPKTSVPGGHDLTQISGVEIQGSCSVPPGHIQSPSAGQSIHVTTSSAAFLPHAYVPLGHSNVHGMLPEPENKPVALSAQCPRHALPAGHGSHAATVVAELIGPFRASMVPGGQNMVHGTMSCPAYATDSTHANGVDDGIPHCTHLASAPEPWRIVPGSGHAVTHGTIVDWGDANLPVYWLAVALRQELWGGHGRHVATDVGVLR